MKKTFNINLAGFPFIIDEDAYNMLNDYLDTIRYAFKSSDDTEELANDIEARIAEILYDKDPEGSRIITLEDVSRVITRIGQPEEIIEIDDSIDLNPAEENVEIGVEENITPPPVNPQQSTCQPFYKKKLYRDPQNSMLGGVCAGLAYYLKVDPTIIRLLTVLLFFLSASTVAIVYIILWIVVPAATTPYQRMQMKGTDPTMENIGKTVKEDFHNTKINESSNPDNNEDRGFINTLVSIALKCLVIIGIVIGGPILLALIIGLFGCVIAAIIIGAIVFGDITGEQYHVFGIAEEGMMVFHILMAVIGGIITIGIPLWLFIKMLLKKKDNAPSSNNRKVLLAIWLIGLALATVFTVKSIKDAKKIDNIQRQERLLFRQDLTENNDISLPEDSNQTPIVEKEDREDSSVDSANSVVTEDVSEQAKIIETEESIVVENNDSTKID